eukprot:c2906_g1_i1 orf=1781-2044(+)
MAIGGGGSMYSLRVILNFKLVFICYLQPIDPRSLGLLLRAAIREICLSPLGFHISFLCALTQYSDDHIGPWKFFLDRSLALPWTPIQ